MIIASKTQSAAAIRAAYEAGAREFGENYVHEGTAKKSELADLNAIRWHLIGHLQTNKARLAVETFAMIQTVDSPRVAAAIRRACGRTDVDVLIEVNIANEASKSGARPSDLNSLVETIHNDVRVAGLMTIPPPGEPAKSRAHFAHLRELRDRVAAQSGLKLTELSMGMTDDFEIAIGEGATMVRIGRAIFGERSQ
jgi:pyridoxal phosphate enzyme (YggS family)